MPSRPRITLTSSIALVLLASGTLAPAVPALADAAQAPVVVSAAPPAAPPLQTAAVVSGWITLPDEAGGLPRGSSFSARLYQATSAGRPTGSPVQSRPLAFGYGAAQYEFDGVEAGRYVVRVVETYRGKNRVALERQARVTTTGVELGWHEVSVGPPITGTAYDADGTRAFGDEVFASLVPCTGPFPKGWSDAGRIGRVGKDGSFSVATVRGHCYAVRFDTQVVRINTLVAGLERVRAGTSDLTVHPRWFTLLDVSEAPRPYGAKSITVHVTPLQRTAAHHLRVPTPDGGTVTLTSGGATVGTAKVVRGRAVVRLSRPLAPGSHRLGVTYSGTKTFAAYREPETVHVQLARTTVEAHATRAGRHGATVTLTLTSPLRPTHRAEAQLGMLPKVRSTAARKTAHGWVQTLTVRHVAAGRYEVQVSRKASTGVASVSAGVHLTVRR